MEDIKLEVKTMTQGMVNVTLGCDYLKSNGHINIDGGIFGCLEEKLRQVYRGLVLPAMNNTQCPDRKGGKCSVNCSQAVTVYQVGCHWSPQQKGKWM